MATLVATQRFNMQTLDVIDLLDYNQLSFSTTLIRLFDDATHFVEIGGSGFIPNAQAQLVGGTITDIDFVVGTPVFEINGASASAAAFYNAAVVNDRDGALSLLFAGNDSLLGSSDTDALLGYAGDDTLTGGAGADTLLGGIGSDTYVVNIGDVVTELASQGKDTVRSGATWTLGTATENLTLTGSSGANGTGNKLANQLTGNSGANSLKGFGAADTLSGGGGNDTLDGGLGNDALSGGIGADTFHFGTAIGPGANVDLVKDLVAGQDQLRLDNDVFTALTPGALASGAFAAGNGLSGGQDADDRLVYDTASGRLYYDADGSGSGAAVQFALLGMAAHPAITFSNFLIID